MVDLSSVVFSYMIKRKNWALVYPSNNLKVNIQLGRCILLECIFSLHDIKYFVLHFIGKNRNNFYIRPWLHLLIECIMLMA